MPDLSESDQRYFIDEHVYNCPFCRRRHVRYVVIGWQQIDWTDSREVIVYFCHCASCEKISMHLTGTKFDLTHVGVRAGKAVYQFVIPEGKKLDEFFFYSVPTSLFSIDQNVPRNIRELLSEAEGSLKSNFLTGASACVRKIVYEMAVVEKAEGNDYETRIKSLKAKRPDVAGVYFDTLLTIQEVTSEKVHEGSYDGWNAKHLGVILSALRDVLQEMYVLPAMRDRMRAEVLALKQAVSKDSKS